MGLPGFDRDRKEYTAAVGEPYSHPKVDADSNYELAAA